MTDWVDEAPDKTVEMLLEEIFDHVEICELHRHEHITETAMIVDWEIIWPGLNLVVGAPLKKVLIWALAMMQQEANKQEKKG